MKYTLLTNPLVLAHRGGGGEFEANTLQAFQNASSLGQVIETDVRADKNGTLYLVHNATSIIPNRPYKTKNGQKYVTLEQLFESFPQANFAIDPKHNLAAEPLAKLIVTHNLVDQVCIGASFNKRTRIVSERIHALSGHYPATALVGLGAQLSLLFWSNNLLKIKQSLHATYIHVPKILISKRSINRAHEADLKIIAWVLNSKDDITTFIDDEGDGFMTDYPSIAKAAIDDSTTATQLY